jgi:hypothetical protein
MYLESVLITALLFAHLAIPSQLLEALRLDAVGNGLGRQEASTLSHLLAPILLSLLV